MRSGVRCGNACQSGSLLIIAATMSAHGLARKRLLAGQHLVEHAAECPDVGSLVHRFATRLLGGHVRGGAQNHAGERGRRTQHGRRELRQDARSSRRLERLGEPKVQYLDRTIGPHFDVRRFEIPVDDAFFMRGFERLGDLTRDRQRLIERDGALRQTIRQRGSLDQFQHERRHVAGFFETVEGRDMRVVQRGQELRFPSKARASIDVAGESPAAGLSRQRLASTACRARGTPRPCRPRRVCLRRDMARGMSQPRASSTPDRPEIAHWPQRRPDPETDSLIVGPTAIRLRGAVRGPLAPEGPPAARRTPLVPHGTALRSGVTARGSCRTPRGMGQFTSKPDSGELPIAPDGAR